VNPCIDKVASSSCTNFLALNQDKCKYMVVSHRRTASTPSQPLQLAIDNHSLDQVKMFKYLGVLLSHDLSWDEHVQSVCSRARKIFGLLYRRVALENVRKFTCYMATKSWDSSYNDLLELVDLPSLECRRLEARLCPLYKIIHEL